MHRITAGSFVGISLLFWTSTLFAQAGRGAPLPRIAPAGGQGRSAFIPHGVFPGLDNDILWGCVAVIAGILVAILGFMLGQALRHWWSGEPSPTIGMPNEDSGSNVDLIIPPEQMAEKAVSTELLLDTLAAREADLDPRVRRAWLKQLFHRVQRCWMDRDYTILQYVLSPELLGSHEQLLQSLRQRGEINCIDELTINGCEFVHFDYPTSGGMTLTALITFTARAYFVNDRTGQHVRGSQEPRQFQEFWTARRQGTAWILQGITRSHQGDFLTRPNRVVLAPVDVLESRAR